MRRSLTELTSKYRAAAAELHDDLPFGYCTNVHAGLTLQDAQANLERIAVRVRSEVAPAGRLPVGLWLPEPVARQLVRAEDVARFADWLAERGLKPYTFNGFPQGDFHQAVVKHAVYEPTWLDRARVDYTCLLADILAGLLPENMSGSISTVPLGWPNRQWNADDFARAAANLQQVARHFDALAQRTGHEIVLAIEPEPGCVLDTAEDIVEFFAGPLFKEDSGIVRRHVTVCHDICHSAVMFESQAHALETYARHGIRVGKLQVSSAIEVPWYEAAGDEATAQAMAAQLRSFNEPRYLHQTTRQRRNDGNNPSVELVEDLPVALRQWLHGEDAQSSTEHSAIAGFPIAAWRVHFHVPIYTERFGLLRATRDDIVDAVGCLHRLRDLQVADRAWFTGDYEVETYAWGVLPPELQVPELAVGIARELEYFRSVLLDA